MMKKIILPLLMGLFLFASCEEEVNESNIQVIVEQYSPVKANAKMKLSGKVHNYASLNKETTKVGFFVVDYSQDAYDFYKNDISSFALDILDVYTSLTHNGSYWDDGKKCILADEIASDGTFNVSFSPKMKQYICVAFAMNILDPNETNSYYNAGQVVVSNLSHFTGESSVDLQEGDPWKHEFKLTFTYADDIELGLCMSTTNQLPNLGDKYVRVSYDSYHEESVDTLVSATISGLDFGDNEVVYLRAVMQKHVDYDYYSRQTSYSNVIEYHPKELVKEINSMDDIRSLFVDSLGNEYTEYWNTYRGTLNFNFEAQLKDWTKTDVETDYSESDYYQIPNLNCTIQGKGVIPVIWTIHETGVVKGMTVGGCDENNGILDGVESSSIGTNNGQILNSTNILVSTNKGEILNSSKVSVQDNYGLVQGCTDVVGYVESLNEHYNKMVFSNWSTGKIINCSIANNNADNTHMICLTNYGYIENCTPDSVCCENNYGVIKGASNAGGGAIVTE